jgi:peptidoglycan/LPS O-acetylase OafA/YrhL
VELISAILIAGPIGYFATTRRRAIALYLGWWAIVFPIQTVVVFSMSDDGNDALYWIFNALILCLGLGMNKLGSQLRERRNGHPAAEVA